MQFKRTHLISKNLTYFALSLMLLVTFCLPSIFIESLSASAYQVTFSVANVQTEYEVGDTVTFNNSDGAIAVVKDPQNSSVEVIDDSFVASMAGTYVVTFTNGNSTTGKIYINVTSETASFNFDTNSEKVMPTTIATGTVVDFPNPEILDEDGEVIEDATATITLKKASSLSYEILADDGDYKSYTFATSGKYELKYTYSAAGYSTIKKTYMITVKDDYEDNVDLTYTTDSSIPTSLVQGVETTLPGVTGKDANNSSATVNVYVDILVEHIGTTTTIMDVEDYTFTPTLAGTYRITYTVTDFYGNVAETTYSLIKNVSDTKAPVVQIVENYTVEENGTVLEATVDNLIDATDLIPTKVATGATISIPAIYASDNVVAFEDLNIRRLIKKGTGSTTNLDDKTISGQEDNKVNESIEYTFDEAGTYTVIYKASDDDNTSSESLYSYSIVVEDGFSDSIAPTVTVKDFIKNTDSATIYSVEPSQEIRISIPSVVDYVDPSDASNSDVNDTSPTLMVYMQVEGSFNDPIELALDEDEEYYEAVVPADATGRLAIIYVAKDDSGNEGSGESANLTKYINIIDTNDSVIPEFELLGTNSYTADQGQEYTMPTVELSDAGENDLTVGVIITLSGNEIDATEVKNLVVYDGVNEVSRASCNVKFVPNKAGIYYVNYVAIDAGGNIIVYTLNVTVESVSTPIVRVLCDSYTMELGEAYIPDAVVYVDGSVVTTAEIQKTITGDINKVGTVTIVYVGIVNGISSEERTITLTIKDSTAPVIILEEEPDQHYDLIYVDDEDEDLGFEAITIPGFTATDSGSKVNYETLKIVVTDSDDEEVESQEGSGTEMSFVPTTDGKYTITYTVSDNAGNESTETRTISVGDIIEPEIEVVNLDDIKTSVSLGSDGEYVLNLYATDANVIITDNGETLDNDDYLSIVVTDSSGNTISVDDDEDYIWTLDTADTYTVTYYATDIAGNVNSDTVLTITVSADDNTGATVSEVLGVVLLVISIIVLLGVIWYFVKPAPKSKKTKKDIE